MNKDTYILGVACFYHDSSATLIKNGSVVAAAAEERFTRVKHDTSFPINAIRFCLEHERITINNVQHIAFYEKPLLKFERLIYQHLATFPLGYKTFLAAMPSWMREKLRVMKTIRKRLKFTGDVFFIPHHLAHAASSFLPSPFDKAAIVTVDGVGEWTTTTIGVGNKCDIRLIKEISFPSSLGLLYSTITAYLGFSVNNSEYKVMGLAAYGNQNPKDNQYYEKLKKVIDIKKDGSYRLNMSFFKFHWANRMPSQKLCCLLDGPVRSPETKITDRHKDIAAALQMILEETLDKILIYAHEITGCENVVLSGGVALNSVYNGKILRNTPFKRLWIQPDAGDGGTSLGAAVFVHTIILGRNRELLEDVYLGPEYSAKEIQAFLNQNNIKYSRFKNEEELIEKTAQLICGGQIVGWFQGRMEWGPRALGSRSILADPTNPGMRDILNIKVKHREEFRPFAPAVPRENASDYYECDEPLPEIADFMLMVYPTKKEWRDKIPSVVHVDGSGRLQTVREKSNPLYYKLIKQVGQKNGLPIVINTSFNVRGEPIVCSPQDAYNCMMNTEIDCLVIGPFLIFRKENL
ncbi:MAG: carbamoyltransferase [Patescibacteria group bacterium]